MTNLKPLKFEDLDFRLTDRNGDPWFLLGDVCKGVGLKNITEAARSLQPEDLADFSLTEVRSGQRRKVRIVSEPGAMQIIMRSDAAIRPGTVAFRFQRWLTTEVLPSIRKYGCYPAPSIDAALATPHQAPEHSTPQQRFVQECSRVAAEMGVASGDVLGLGLMPKGRWLAMQRGDGSMAHLFKDMDMVRALVGTGFDLKYVLTGIWAFTPQERRVVGQLRMEGAGLLRLG